MGNMVTLSVTATTCRTQFAYFRLSATSQRHDHGSVISDVIYLARGPNLGTQLCVTLSCQLSSSVAFDVHTVKDVVVCQSVKLFLEKTICS
jgi:hypothetical protein